MAEDLLSPGDWAEIRDALQSPMITFFKMPCIYIRRQKKQAAAFQEQRDQIWENAQFPLLCLFIPDKTDDSALTMRTQQGSMDLTEGVMYFNYKVLKEHSPPFINAAGESTFVVEQDSFLVLGIERRIIGVALVGPTESDFQMVKVAYKNVIK